MIAVCSQRGHHSTASAQYAKNNHNVIIHRDAPPRFGDYSGIVIITDVILLDVNCYLFLLLNAGARAKSDYIELVIILDVTISDFHCTYYFT